MLTVTATDYDNGGEIVTKSDSSGSFTFTVTSPVVILKLVQTGPSICYCNTIYQCAITGGSKSFDDVDGIAPTFTIKADDGQSSNNVSNTFNGKYLRY